MKFKFKVHLLSSFYANELYDENGSEIFNLEDAIRVAKDRYPNDSWEVYNGNDGFLYEVENGI